MMRFLTLPLVCLGSLFLTACWDFGSDAQLLEPAAPDEGLYPIRLTIEVENNTVSVCERFGSNDYNCRDVEAGDGAETEAYRITAFSLAHDTAYPDAATHMFIVTNINPDSTGGSGPEYFYYIGAGYVEDGKTVLFSLDMESTNEEWVTSTDDLINRAAILALERYKSLSPNEQKNSDLVFRPS